MTSKKNNFLLQKLQKINVFIPNFCCYIVWMSNNLDLRWSPTCCGASSGSKLFLKVIKGLQSWPLVGKELNWFDINLISKKLKDEKNYETLFFLLVIDSYTFRPGLSTELQILQILMRLCKCTSHDMTNNSLFFVCL